MEMRKKLIRAWKHSGAVKIILVIEAAALLLLLANCLRGRCDRSFTANQSLWSTNSLTEAVWDENGTGCYIGSGEAMDETILSTDNFRLWPGAYRVTVHYSSQVDYDENAGISNSTGYLTLKHMWYEEGGYFTNPYVTFEDLLLRDGMNTVEQTMQITSPFLLTGLSMKVNFTGQGELTVYSVEVEEILAYRYLCLLGIFIIFGVFDMISYSLFIDKSYKYTRELGIMTLICLAGILPFLADFSYVGHDSNFHIARIACLAGELKNGNFFPAIYTTANNGYGYVAPVFYGHLFLYLPAVLYNCGFSMTFAYNFYLCVMTVATSLIMYYCGLKMFDRSSSALLACAMYTFNPLRLVHIFTRAAIGDVTARTFFPLIALGIYHIYTAPKGERITLKKYWPIVVGLTCILSCHMISVIMSVILIFGVCLVFIRKTLEPQRLLGWVKATILTLLINLAVVVPLLDSMQMDLYVKNITYMIQNSGLYLVQILNPVAADYKGSSGNGTISGDMSFSIGFSVIFGLILFLVCLAWQKNEKVVEDKKLRLASVGWGFCVLTILLSTVYAFYDYFYYLPQAVYYVITICQFSWRWLAFAVLAGVLCTAFLLDGMKTSAFKYASIVCICAMLVMNTGQIYSDEMKSASVSVLSNNAFKWQMNIGKYGSEYLIWQTDTDQFDYRDLICDDQIAAGEYIYENGTGTVYAENLSDDSAALEIPLINYDHYIAVDSETGDMFEIEDGENHRVRLIVPAHYSGTITIKYQIPALWKFAVGISVATDISMIVWTVLKKAGRKRRVRV